MVKRFENLEKQAASFAAPQNSAPQLGFTQKSPDLPFCLFTAPGNSLVVPHFRHSYTDWQRTDLPCGRVTASSQTRQATTRIVQ